MNKTYKSIFNHHTQTWVATSENTAACGKRSGSKLAASTLLAVGTFLGVVSGGAEAATLTCTTSAATGSDVVCGPYATANTGQSVSIGYYAQATGDQSVALGANAQATGNSSVSIGGDDLDKVASTAPPTWNVNAPNTNNNTAAAIKYKALTGDDLVNFADATKRYVPTQAGTGAVALGVQAVASGELGTAFGTKAKALAVASVGLGVGANASLENAVALGAGATTATNATAVTSATVGTGASG